MLPGLVISVSCRSYGLLIVFTARRCSAFILPAAFLVLNEGMLHHLQIMDGVLFALHRVFQDKTLLREILAALLPFTLANTILK